MPSSRANLPCGRSYAAARAKYVKKDVMVGVTYRVRAEEVEEATDNDETNNSFDGTAAVAVVEERHRRLLLMLLVAALFVTLARWR